MRRKRAFRRGRAIPILAATGVGYLIGSWNAAAVHSRVPASAPTAAQTIALRFPQDLSDTPVVQATAYEHRVASANMVMDDAQLALFQPEPMVAQPAAEQAAALPAPQQTADMAPAPAARPVTLAMALPPSARTVATPIWRRPEEEVGAAKPHPAALPRPASHAGSFLDDAQIASIKRRLHLTPDQEQMWPAVEAALRNIAVARAHEVRSRGAAGAIDPNSTEVQDLKSAAIPLLMSFSDQQKDEVRNLAHGMGLDQLASEF